MSLACDKQLCRGVPGTRIRVGQKSFVIPTHDEGGHIQTPLGLQLLHSAGLEGKAAQGSRECSLAI